MTVSAKLYSCWNSVPSTSGSANSKMRVSGRPVVRSVVPEVGFFIGRSPFCNAPRIVSQPHTFSKVFAAHLTNFAPRGKIVYTNS